MQKASELKAVDLRNLRSTLESLGNSTYVVEMGAGVSVSLDGRCSPYASHVRAKVERGPDIGNSRIVANGGRAILITDGEPTEEEIRAFRVWGIGLDWREWKYQTIPVKRDALGLEWVPYPFPDLPENVLVTWAVMRPAGYYEMHGKHIPIAPASDLLAAVLAAVNSWKQQGHLSVIDFDAQIAPEAIKLTDEDKAALEIEMPRLRRMITSTGSVLETAVQVLTDILYQREALYDYEDIMEAFSWVGCGSDDVPRTVELLNHKVIQPYSSEPVPHAPVAVYYGDFVWLLRLSGGADKVIVSPDHPEKLEGAWEYLIARHPEPGRGLD